MGRFILHHNGRAPGAWANRLQPVAPVNTLPVIDVSSEQLHLSMAGDAPVVFGTVTGEVYRLREYLQAQAATTVALDATAVYWVYAELEAAEGRGEGEGINFRPRPTIA